MRRYCVEGDSIYIYIGEGLLFISLCNENCDINILMEEFPKHGLTNLQNKKNKKTQQKKTTQKHRNT